MHSFTFGLAVVWFFSWVYFLIKYPEKDADMAMVCANIWLAATIVIAIVLK